MANWVHLNAGYDSGDETVLFGTRAFAQTEEFIYETSTHATIQAETEVNDAPSLSSESVPGGHVCISVDSSLFIFEDQSYCKVVSHNTFDSKIDTFCFSSDGRFLFVGLLNGFIHCLHIPTGGQLVFSKKLGIFADKNAMLFKMFVEDTNDVAEIFSICNSGFTFSLQNVDLDAFDSSCIKNDTAALKDLVSKITQKIVLGESSISPLKSVTMFKNGKCMKLLAVGKGIATASLNLGSEISDLYKCQWDECHFNSSETLIKVESLPDETLSIALSNIGELLLVCSDTLTVQPVLRGFTRLSDFKLFVSPSSEAHIVGVSHPNKEGKANLVMFSVQGRQEKFSLPIKWPSKLMSTSTDLEDLFFLECSSVEESSGFGLIAVKAASQTNPKFRMDRMLNKRKFKDAEAIAKMYGLDMTSIFMAQAKHIVEKMQPWKRELSQPVEANRELYQSLVDKLDQISDVDFVCECCITAIPPDYETASSLFHYAQTRLELFVVNNPELEIKVVDWSQKIFSAMLRLETMNLVNQSWDVDHWLMFCSCDLIGEVQRYLIQGDLLEAATIWSRHETEMKRSLLSGKIKFTLLECIPPNICLDKLLIWLKHMLPVVLEVQPESLAAVAEWTEKKLCVLERSNFRDWTQMGLKYTDKALELFSSQKMAGPFLGVECSPLRSLVQLHSDFSELHILHSKFYIHFSLEEYRQDPAEVAMLMLDKVEVTTMSSLIKEFLGDFMLDHKLLQDEVISNYISGVLQSSVGWWYWDSAPWETRIAELTYHISNFKLRLECIISTLDVAPIPWSPIVSNLAENGLQLKHPLSSQIREKQKQVATNLILKKYGLKGNISKLDKRRLIRYIIKQNRPELLDDVAQLSKDSEEKAQAYTILFMHYVDLGEVKKASELLWSLPSDVSVMMCPHLVQISCQSALLGLCSVDCVLDFLGTIECRFKAAVNSPPHCVALVEDLSRPILMPLSILQFKNMMYLKRDFGKTLSIAQMSSSKCRLEVLKDCIQDLVLEVVEKETENFKVERLYQRTIYLARLLQMTRVAALTELVEQMHVNNDMHLAADISRRIDDFHEVAESFYPRLITLAENFLSKSKDVLHFVMPQRAAVLKRTAQGAYNLLAKASIYCSSDAFNRIFDIIGWAFCWCIACENITETENTMGPRDALQQWRITPVYRDPGIAVMLDSSILVQFVLDAHDTMANEADVSTIIALPERVQKLQNDQHDLTALLIISQLLSSFLNDSSKHVSEIYKSVCLTFMKLSESLLMKVVSARQLDLGLGLNLLLHLKQDLALDFLQKKTESSCFDLNKQKHFASLGMSACTLWKKSDYYNQFQQSFLLSTWGLKLPDHGIPSKEILHDLDCQGILQKLILSKNITVSVIQSFCGDYGLDLQGALLSHLENILLSWDPNPLVTVNSEGNKVMVERNTQQQLFDDCWEIQNNIEAKDALRKLLYDLWVKVSFYHHEVFLVILDMLERIGVSKDLNSKRLLTTFLKSYQRIHPPDAAEEEFWIHTFPNSCSLPLIAEFRLPYSPCLLESPLSIVRKEITLDTYKNWLSMAMALNLTKDNICVIAVHETVTEAFSGTSMNAKWCATVKNEALFTAVAECVALMDEIVKAAATLFFFTNKVPPGADQVSAASLCMRYAVEVARTTGETEYKHKVERKYLTLGTTQILYTYGLGQPCYLQLINKPQELLQELYQHPNILETCRGTAHHRLDVNGAAQEICEWNSICLKTLHLGLIMDWLQPEPLMSGNNSVDEDTMSGMSLAVRRERQANKDSTDFFSQNDDNILRARYVMESGDVQDWALMLLSLVFGAEQATGIRLRALQCVCMLTDDETLEELSGRTVIYLREHYRSLAYVMELECLGLAYSETGFAACDKKDLALLVIRTSLRRPRAISFVINLCLDYGVTDLSVWGPVLHQMVDLAMIEELEQLLPRLTSTYQLWNLPSFKSAWTLVLVTPFTQAYGQFSDDRLQTVFRALELFPLCPVTNSIKLCEAVECCLSAKRLDLIALLLPFIKSSERLSLINKCFASNELTKLEDKIMKLPVNDFLKNKTLDILKNHCKEI